MTWRVTIYYRRGAPSIRFFPTVRDADRFASDYIACPGVRSISVKGMK